MSEGIADSEPATTALVVGVTGHRNLREADVDALAAQVRACFLDLRARYPALPLVVLTPLAEGADSLVADVAFELGLRVVAVLPLPVELYRDDFESPANLARFERQLERSEVLVLPLRGDARSMEVWTPGSARDRQYAEVGMFVSRHCHLLIALWDGQDQASLGGTSHVVDFHLHGEAVGRPGQRRAALSLLGLSEDSLVRHIPTARVHDVEPATSHGPWLTAHDQVVAHTALPDAFDRMFRLQAAFNDDAGRYAAAIAESATAGDTQAGAIAGSCPIEGQHVAADWLARAYQRRVARVLALTYVLAAATGAAFILYSDAGSQLAMIYVYLLLFFAGVGLAVLARRRDWHRKYLDYRALAEGLRVQSYWRRAGVVDMAHPAAANENFMQEQDTELGWIRNVLRAASLEGLLVPTAAGPDAVDAVVREWIGTPASDGQLRYFTVTGARRARQHRQAGRLALASLGAGLAICVVLALYPHRWDPSVNAMLVVAMGLLSLGAGVHEAYAHKKADKELVRQYRFMQRIYAGARRRLDAASGIVEKREILRVLGEAALTEHAEWTLMHRERPLQHTRLG